MFRIKTITILLTIALSTTAVGFSQMAYSSEDPLIIGVFPRRNATLTTRLFRPMATYLSAQLGRDIRLVTSKNFKVFWENVISQTYDIVHYNQYHYILSNKEMDYQVILRNSELGESTIAGSIIIRKDSGIKKVTDLKGKTIVFGGGPKAMQSYIVARYLLQQAGLEHGNYIEKFAISPPNAIFSAYYKQSVAAGSGDKVLELDVVNKKISTSQMKFLVRGEQLPHLPWAVKGSMDKNLSKKIQDILSSLEKTEKGRLILKQAKLTGLVKTTDKEYNRHREIVDTVFGKETLNKASSK